MRSFTRKAAKDYYRIGVVGYSSAYFDRAEAQKKFETLLSQQVKKAPSGSKIAIVSGLTNVGIPAIAYQVAEEKGYYTVGYACKKAEDFALYPVDDKNIIGSDWGDESDEFLSNIDSLIRIGGGKQSEEETKKAKELGLPVAEKDLPKKVSYCLMGSIAPETSKDLHKAVKKAKARDIKTQESYHVTIRFWLADPEDTDHLKKIKEFLRDRFEYPTSIELDFEGDTDVFGDEEAYVLHVTSPILTAFQKEIDEELQKLGAPPSDYPDYRPHVTVAEGIEKELKLEPCRLRIDRWFLTKGTDPNADSELVWEADFSDKVVTAGKRVTAQEQFVESLKRASNAAEVVDYLIFNTPKRTTDETVFDHFLLLFFAGLNDFAGRKDFDEEEVEQFKGSLPYEEYHLDRQQVVDKIRYYRSINRIIDCIVDQLPEDVKTDLARKHLLEFWFEEKCGHDLDKFVTALKPSYWLRED